jgi:cardiolipin synthase
VYKTFVSAFSRTPSRSIHLTQAYFVPDGEMLKTLTAAARPRVQVVLQVVLIVPSLSDSWLALNAGRSHYSELLNAGAHIFERSGAFLHAKTAIIDGVWSTVGSANLAFGRSSSLFGCTTKS